MSRMIKEIAVNLYYNLFRNSEGQFTVIMRYRLELPVEVKTSNTAIVMK